MVTHGTRVAAIPHAAHTSGGLRVEMETVILGNPESPTRDQEVRPVHEAPMSYSMPAGPAVTVVAGQTKSPAMVNDYTISDADQITFKSPTGLVAAASLEVSVDFNVNYLRDGITLAAATAAATWQAPTSPALGAAGAISTKNLSDLTAMAWRISLAAGDAADRTFLTTKRLNIQS